MYHVNDELPEFRPEPLASIVKRLGNPESTVLLHSPCKVFQTPNVDGLIGYHRVGKCAVVIGDPICLPQDIPELTNAFHEFCQKKRLKTLYVLACQDFAYWALNNGCRTLIQTGSEISINPSQFQKKQKLRWKINQSIQKGVEVKEYTHLDPSLELEMKSTVHTWSKGRRGPQIHLGVLNFFNSDIEKRVFYATREDKMIGLLMLTPVDRFQGWVLSTYLALPDAPVGTTENLICTCTDTLAEENCPFMCLGLVSGTQLGEIIGLGPLGKKMANFIFTTAQKLFNLNAKDAYLNKYNPNLRSTFLVCRERLSITELLALKHILNVKL
jgi:lysylphosphatidylglycerol synthetase-like protein (DUF2156 family)